jgi:uncharacterized iron-regulated membrane protein
MPPNNATDNIVVERYKYILQQLHSVNENVFRFFTIFQTLVTAIVTAALALFVGFSTWGIQPHTARIGIQGLLVLLTLVAAFAMMLIIAGAFSWWDYRREECEMTTRYVSSSLRKPPALRNFYRWYETYIVLFILATTVVLWVLGENYLIANIK